jgi:outer membrane protein OmpA-like peptidoglycan-associated protein
MSKEAFTKTRILRLTALALIPVVFTGCAAMQTDTGQGAAIGGGGGALIGALADSGNPLAGALIGAAGGALLGGAIGHFMDERKQNLQQALQPEINSGAATVTELPGKALQVSMTGQSAFAPGSAVINPDFIPTLQKIGGVVSKYGKMAITVIGYPDASGTAQQQETLANQRAEAVRLQFLGMGVKPILLLCTGNSGSPIHDGRVQLVLTPIRAT